jgi:hypothetical protein
MNLALKASQAPTRIAAGAFILNSGLSKLRAKPDEAEHLHAMAKSAYPIVDRVSPETFTRVLSLGEIGLGATLLTPFAPSWLAGAGLTGFSSALLGIYARTPGMHEEHGPRPTPEGLPLAKDVWLASIGVSILLRAASKIRLPGMRKA